MRRTRGFTMGRTHAEQQNGNPEATTPPDEESFIEKMERAARGELGAHPADDPDLTGEDRFDAG